MKARVGGLLVCCLVIALAFAPAQAAGYPPGLVGYAATIGGAPRGIAVQGDHAYLTDFADAHYAPPSGLNVFDVSDPAHPRHVWHSGTRFRNESADIAIAGDYALVANDADGLLVYDLSAPASPTFVTRARGRGPYAHAISTTVLNDRPWALVGGPYEFSLEAFDVGSLPAVAGPYRWNPPDGLTETPQVFAQGQRAYILAYRVDRPTPATNYAFKVLDISDPTRIRQISRLDLALQSYGRAGNIRVRGRHAFVSFGEQGGVDGGLAVIDISDETRPFLAKFLKISRAGAGVEWRGTGMDLDGDRVVFNARDRILVIDVAVPDAPVIQAEYPTPAAFGRTQGGDVQIVGDLAYVAVYNPGPGTRGGLAVYQLPAKPQARSR